MASELVPRAVLSPPEAARKRVGLVVAAASGAAGLAGVWFRFDDGLAFRVVLALTSALFGWLVIAFASSAKDGLGAAMRALGISVALGAVSTVFPCLMIGGVEDFRFMLIWVPLGAVFGSMVGFLYGIVLAVVAAATCRHVRAATHDGADRAVRNAAVWAIVPLAVMAFVVFSYDVGAELPSWAPESRRDAHAVAGPLGILAIGIVFVVAFGSYLVATRRLSRRRRWLADVTSGSDPRWGVRAIGPHDDVARLPRLREGFSVLEHENERAVYRANATGEAVAVI